jgi:hypothetical protein
MLVLYVLSTLTKGVSMKTIAEMHGQGPQGVIITPAMKKQARNMCTAWAVKHYGSDRIAFKATKGTQSAMRRASKRPGPVILRSDTVARMNEQLKGAA